MKIKGFIILVLVVITFSSCTDDENTNLYNAVVLRQGNKCGTNTASPTLDYLIEFNANFNDLPVQGERIYYASNLPEAFKVDGLQVLLTFREPNYDNAEEVMNCATFVGGDDFPQIWITSAE